MLKRGCEVLVLVMAALMLPLSAGAEDANTEGVKTQVFDDWGRRCETPNEDGKEICFILQQLKVKESNQTILFITVGYPPTGKKPAMVLTTPLGVSLLAGIQMVVDDSKDLVKVPYSICMTNGCRATLLMEEAFIKTLQEGEKLYIAYANVQGKGFKLEVSLKGFADALASLK